MKLRKPNPDQAVRRAVRRADKAVQLSLQLRAVVGHVTLTSREATAWFVMDPHNVSWRDDSDVEGHIFAGSAALARLGAIRTYWRVTDRPLAVREWAEKTYRDAVEHGDPLPGFPDFLEREQRRLLQCGYSTKIAFLGVRVAQTRKHPLDPRREVAALQDRLDDVADALSSEGLRAVPATPEQMELLLRRSVSLGLPSPRLDTITPSDYELADLPQLDQLATVTAEPFAKTAAVQTTTEAGEVITRRVAVLTMGRTGRMNVPQDRKGGWMHRTDQLPFSVEWMATVDLLDQTAVGNSLRHQMDVIADQWEHYTNEHKISPPESLRQQHAEALEAEQELNDGLGGDATRTQGWYRLAVWGDTEREVLQRVAEVRKLYGRDVEWWHSGGQAALVREFIPGEPLANQASRRRFVLPGVLAALPAASAQIGDDYGASIGGTSGHSRTALFTALHRDMEQRDRSGVMLSVGGLGSGKSTLDGLLVYRTVMGGVQWSILDPSGRMGTLCELPELQAHSRYYDLSRGRAGELSFYLVVADPTRDHYGDKPGADELWQEDLRAAESTRRGLARDVLTAFLPATMRRDRATVRVISRAVRSTPATASTEPAELLANLLAIAEGKSELDLTPDDRIAARDVYGELDDLSRSSRGRLIFGSAPGIRGSHLLEVYSLANMQMPTAEALAAGEESTDTRMAIGLFQLAAWKVQSRTYADDPNKRKGLLIEEAHLLQQIPSGPALLNKTAVDTRKHNLRAILSSQNPGHFDLAELSNLVGIVAVGKTTDMQPGGAGEAALTLLGRPHEKRHLHTLASLSPEPKAKQPKFREFVFATKDDTGSASKIERCVVDLYAHPHVLEALGTTPSGGAGSADSGRLHSVKPEAEVA